MITDIYRIRAHDSIMCGDFCIGFIDFILKGNTCFIIQNYFFQIIIGRNNTKIFSISKKVNKLYCVICGKYRNVEKSEISYLLEKTLVLSIICSKCRNECEKIFKEEDSN